MLILIIVICININTINGSAKRITRYVTPYSRSLFLRFYANQSHCNHIFNYTVYAAARNKIPDSKCAQNIKNLIASNIHVDYSYKEVCTPLHVAFKFGLTHTVKALLTQPDANIYCIDAHKKTPLHVLCDEKPNDNQAAQEIVNTLVTYSNQHSIPLDFTKYKGILHNIVAPAAIVPIARMHPRLLCEPGSFVVSFCSRKNPPYQIERFTPTIISLTDRIFHPIFPIGTSILQCKINHFKKYIEAHQLTVSDNTWTRIYVTGMLDVAEKLKYITFTQKCLLQKAIKF